MIKVKFDSQIFQLQKQGGISRYFTELAKAFYDYPELGILPIFNFKYTINTHLFYAFPNSGFKLIKNPILVYFLKFWAVVSPTTTRGHIDIIHHTFYAKKLHVLPPDVISVSTHHDMIPELMNFERPVHWYKMRYLIKSDGVIAVSKQAIEQYNEVADHPRIDMKRILLGVNAPTKQLEVHFPWFNERYFLYIGDRSGYKRSDLVLQAFIELNPSNIHLVFVGGGAFSKNEKNLINKSNQFMQIHQVNVSDEELDSLYQNSQGLIFPSDMEGFGLPVLEAAISNCPLILSDIPTFKEVIGESALFFKKGDYKALLKILDQAIHGKMNTQLTTSAHERAVTLTWLKCASETASYYKDLISMQARRKSPFRFY